MARVIPADQYIDLVMHDVGDLPEFPDTIAPAHVHISRDNWIAECAGETPHTKIVQHDTTCESDCDEKHDPPLTVTTYGNCGYAIVVSLGLPMVCPTHGWFSVELPQGSDDIEALLDARPDPLNRNWFPNETVKDLKQENRDHGVD